MNFLPGEIAGGSLRFPLATIPLADAQPAGLGAYAREVPVLVGIRPEAFEDAALARQRPRGITVRTLRLEC